MQSELKLAFPWLTLALVKDLVFKGSHCWKLNCGIFIIFTEHAIWGVISLPAAVYQLNFFLGRRIKYLHTCV
jgi:hypothetical protein